MIGHWPWQAFCSLSWRNRRGAVPSESLRERIFFGWVRQVGKTAGVVGKGGVDFLWCRRDELGERTQREHLHVLLGGLPEWFVRDFVLRPKPAIGSWWECHGGGNARTSPVYSAAEVAEYITKENEEAREYELRKFGLRCRVMFSHHAETRLFNAVGQLKNVHLGARNTADKTGD